MIYAIIELLPSSENPNHIFAWQNHVYYYETEEEAKKAKAKLDRDYPEWQNVIVSFIKKF